MEPLEGEMTETLSLDVICTTLQRVAEPTRVCPSVRVKDGVHRVSKFFSESVT